MKHTNSFLSYQESGINRFKFVSDTTGAIRYCEIDHDNKTYTTNYYKYNGGWNSSEIVPLYMVKAAEQWAIGNGYIEKN